MPNLKDYEQIVKKKEGELQRLKGREEQLLKGLKDEGFDNVGEAELYLQDLTKEIDELETEFDGKLKAFQNKYGALLEEA